MQLFEYSLCTLKPQKSDVGLYIYISKFPTQRPLKWNSDPTNHMGAGKRLGELRLGLYT